MPSVSDNRNQWDGAYRWTERGDEWSAAWGGPPMQWHGTILPRIHGFVPTGRILEIACGYGRWTQFLKEVCRELTVIDLSEECVEACRRRFAGCAHIEYHVNDGKSLQMVADDSVDFVFSFDSLVHADASVLEAYLSQLPRILKAEGAAFVHHSNLGEYGGSLARFSGYPRVEALLKRLGMVEKSLHWRDGGVSAALVERLAAKSGLTCRSQEIVPWGTKHAFIDCLSTIVRNGSSLDRGNRILRNDGFMREATYLRRLARLYGADRKPAEQLDR